MTVIKKKKKDTSLYLLEKFFHNHDNISNICLNCLLCSGCFSEHSLALFINAINKTFYYLIPCNFLG